MPPITDVKQSQLGSRFWISKDTESFQKVYDNSKLSVPSFSAPHLTRVKASDRRMLSLAQNGVSDKLKNVFGQAKAFAEKIDVDSLASNTDLLEALGNEDLQDLATSVVRILVQDEIQRNVSERHKVADEVENAKNVLKLMLATDDFKDLQLAPDASAADKDKVRLALVNATAGALRLVWDGNATYDSIFELSKGELFDLAKGADVYKLAVATAEKARVTFIDKAGLEAKAKAILGVEELPDQLKEAVGKVVTAREKISGVLGKVEFDAGDGKTATVEKKLKEVRERMRAFRYDIDRKMGTVKAGMEGVRRWFDDINGVQDGREAVQQGFKEEAEAINELNQLLGVAKGAGNWIKSCLEAESTTKATDLTHTANNEIRYYFTGKERKLDVFSAKAYGVFGEMKNGESRTVKLTLGGKVAGELGVAEADASIQYARTVKVSKSGGEYVLTLVEGAEVEGKAAFGVSPEENGVGGGVTASFSGGSKKSVSYKSVSDLIADLKGEDQVVSATSNSTRLCLGYAWSRLKKVGKGIGNGLLDLATTLGFREHHSRMIQNEYQAKLVNTGIIAGLDRMLVANQHAVKTVETKAVQFSGGFGGFVTGKFAAFGAVDVSGGVSGKYTSSTDRFVKSVAYRPLTEKLAILSDDRLMELCPNFVAPSDLAEAKSRLKGMEDRMRQLEVMADSGNVDDREAYLDDFANDWKALAAETVLLVHRAEVFLAGLGGEEAKALRSELYEIGDVIAFHLDRPRVTMTDQEFDARFLEKLFTDDNGTVTHTGEVTVGYNVIDGLTSFFNDSVGLPGEDAKNFRASVASRFVNKPSQTVLNTTIPLDQTVSAKVTTSHKVRRDDVRPWVNESSTDVEVSCSANLAVRALCLFVANLVFKGNGKDNDLSGEAPELKDLFFDDMRSNLADAEKDFMEQSIFDALGRKLKLPKGGKFGSAYDNTNFPTIRFHFENGRLVSIAEVEKGVTKGSLSFGADINGVKVGLKAESTLTEVSMRRKMIVKPPLTALLAKTEAVLRGGKGVTSVEAFLDKDPESTPHTLYRLANMFKGVAIDPAKDPRFEQDGAEARNTLANALTLLTKAKAKDAERFGYRVDVLKARLHDASVRLDAMRAADIGDEEKRAKVLHLVARILTDMSRAYTLAKEAGFKAGDEEI